MSFMMVDKFYNALHDLVFWFENVLMAHKTDALMYLSLAYFGFI